MLIEAIFIAEDIDFRRVIPSAFFSNSEKEKNVQRLLSWRVAETQIF